MTEDQKDRYISAVTRSRVLAEDCRRHHMFLESLAHQIDTQQFINRSDMVDSIRSHLHKYPFPGGNES